MSHDETVETAEPTWRVGRKLERTLYVKDQYVGIMDDPILARRIVRAMNDPRRDVTPTVNHLQCPVPCSLECDGINAVATEEARESLTEAASNYLLDWGFNRTDMQVRALTERLFHAWCMGNNATRSRALEVPDDPRREVERVGPPRQGSAEAFPCTVSTLSSAMCVRGTKGCTSHLLPAEETTTKGMPIIHLFPGLGELTHAWEVLCPYCDPNDPTTALREPIAKRLTSPTRPAEAWTNAVIEAARALCRGPYHPGAGVPSESRNDWSRLWEALSDLPRTDKADPTKAWSKPSLEDAVATVLLHAMQDTSVEFPSCGCSDGTDPDEPADRGFVCIHDPRGMSEPELLLRDYRADLLSVHGDREDLPEALQRASSIARISKELDRLQDERMRTKRPETKPKKACRDCGAIGTDKGLGELCLDQPACDARRKVLRDREREEKMALEREQRSRKVAAESAPRALDQSGDARGKKAPQDHPAAISDEDRDTLWLLTSPSFDEVTAPLFRALESAFRMGRRASDSTTAEIKALRALRDCVGDLLHTNEEAPVLGSSRPDIAWRNVRWAHEQCVKDAK